MINWAEEASAWRPSSNWGRIGRNDAIYRVEGEKLCRVWGRARAAGQPRVIASGDHVAKDDLDEAKGTQRLRRAERPWRRAWHLARHAEPTRMATVVDSGRRVALTHLRATYAGNASGGLASVGDLAKSKTKKEKDQGRSTARVHYAARLSSLR